MVTCGADRVPLAEQAARHRASRAPPPAARCPHRSGSGRCPGPGRGRTPSAWSPAPRCTRGERARRAGPHGLAGGQADRDPVAVADDPGHRVHVGQLQPGHRRRGAEVRPGPGTTSSRLEPSPSTCCSTCCLVPVPMATSITTAATPMITPSMVSPLRSRLARSASSATRHASAEPHVGSHDSRRCARRASTIWRAAPGRPTSRSWVTTASATPALGVELLQQVEHRLAGGAVQVAGRLVGQQHRRLGDQRPGDRHPLLLAAGELVGPVVDAGGRGRPGPASPRPGGAARPARTPR